MTIMRTRSLRPKVSPLQCHLRLSYQQAGVSDRLQHCYYTKTNGPRRRNHLSRSTSWVYTQQNKRHHFICNLDQLYNGIPESLYHVGFDQHDDIRVAS
jgi:hypothetical protein